ncbi:SDR family NAD(P)-dependent oxidoreductase [Actinoplanes sp. M2I2]|uniref:SDR family NAD(P)-dependent oxidoreductase n=1 Tax=Actinoplanes sp. M2I2 TaxID=1734444 RepID=UPI00202154BD|nr:SDR family NAD(P)-dependent oxidoreductase [Actinoplanes sp. M2I2]
MTDGRTALITGGTGGLGAATVAAFVAEGWRVVTPVRPGSAERLPKGAVAVDGDMTVETDVTAAVAAATADPEASLRAVVNLIGGFASGPLVAETPWSDFEAQLRLNLRPTYLVTAAALPALVEAGGGSIVCVSSRTALAPFPGAAGYATSKAAVIAFANAVAVEYRKRNVRCNTVVPSVIDTDANRAAMPDADPARWVRPEQIARTILFLASDASVSTSGAQIPVYGQA